ncbi:MAG: DUF1292 domain-containing protein [Lachnospiraceae bacterium]|nr:DUF1292 domain-containing protein [Lachnospiraceae bacterium]
MDQKKVMDEKEEMGLLGEFVVEDENGNEVTLYMIDTTKINGVEYVLATDTQDDGGCGFIFKMTPVEGTDDVMLDNVSDDEYDYISKIFAETADVDFEA